MVEVFVVFFYYSFMPCVYFPHENSTQQFDGVSLYDHLLACIYQYQKNGDFIVCGDFNCKSGALDDYIVGKDDVP